jgi:hypothetical protein
MVAFPLVIKFDNLTVSSFNIQNLFDSQSVPYVLQASFHNLVLEGICMNVFNCTVK